MSKALKVVKSEPAVILYSVNALLALLIAYGLPLAKTPTAAVITIVTALLTVTAAPATRRSRFPRSPPRWRRSPPRPARSACT